MILMRFLLFAFLANIFFALLCYCFSCNEIRMKWEFMKTGKNNECIGEKNHNLMKYTRGKFSVVESVKMCQFVERAAIHLNNNLEPIHRSFNLSTGICGADCKYFCSHRQRCNIHMPCQAFRRLQGKLDLTILSQLISFAFDLCKFKFN